MLKILLWMKWNWNAASAAHLIDTTVAIWKYCFARQTNAPCWRARPKQERGSTSAQKWRQMCRQWNGSWTKGKQQPSPAGEICKTIDQTQTGETKSAPVGKESPTNRNQVQSVIFVMCCNCKMIWCFHSVRLTFHLGLMIYIYFYFYLFHLEIVYLRRIH